ncbi:uncharacterized protein TNCV_3267411 [Trichonephila clavipes]|nr:uncharacterized protein TNCV_3267411 [Trichonephila clavipes]
MISCNHMCPPHGNHEKWLPQKPFFNKTMLGFTRQGCYKTVTTLPWPARSPGLSPIEHIWDHLRRRIGHPPSLIELEAGLQQI